MRSLQQDDASLGETTFLRSAVTPTQYQSDRLLQCDPDVAPKQKRARAKQPKKNKQSKS